MEKISIHTQRIRGINIFRQEENPNRYCDGKQMEQPHGAKGCGCVQHRDTSSYPDMKIYSRFYANNAWTDMTKRNVGPNE